MFNQAFVATLGVVAALLTISVVVLCACVIGTGIIKVVESRKKQ